MEGYTADEESRREWSQSSQWMQQLADLIFKSNQTLISQILHPQNLLYGPNLLPSPYSAFRPPSITPMQGVQLESLPNVGAGILEGKNEVATTAKKQLVGKKNERVQKE